MEQTSVLSLLMEAGEGYISGEAMSQRLGITRAAVWKQIAKLRQRGYVIEASTRLGYRLSAQPEPLEQERILEQTVPHDARLEFSDYMNKWLNSVRSTIATATYQSYANMLKARIIPYFEPRGIAVMDLTPQDIEDFYQKVLADGCTTNTVIHYHAIIRKALQSAVRKDTIAKNPADKVDRPKKRLSWHFLQ